MSQDSGKVSDESAVNDKGRSPLRQSSQHVVKLRGLPWSATKEEVMHFMAGCNIKNGVDGIHMVSRHGPIRGEAYIELESERDVELAMAKHREHMGSRYIEVFHSTMAEMNHVMNPKGSSNWRDPVVRLRGVPYYCTKDDIYDFFSGLQIAHNGVYISMDDAGNASGLAFVAFTKMDAAYKALEKHRMMIGHRYVEVFQSSYSEARARMVEDLELSGTLPFYSQRPDEPRMSSGGGHGGGGGAGSGVGVYDSLRTMSSRMDDPRYYGSGGGSSGSRRSGGGGFPGSGAPSSGGGGMSSRRYGGGEPHTVLMFGLPYKCTEMDIIDFFKPMRPLSIHLKYDQRGRPSGQAVVEFGSHGEALEAMKYDKQYIGSRYVDLALDAPRNDYMGGSGSHGYMHQSYSENPISESW